MREESRTAEGNPRRPTRVAAFHASGLRIRPSKWASGDPPDLIQFAFVGKRGAQKAEATMTPEAAEFYWEELGRLLGKGDAMGGGR